jgi:hypothetical protein
MQKERQIDYSSSMQCYAEDVTRGTLGFFEQFILDVLPCFLRMPQSFKSVISFLGKIHSSRMFDSS